MGSALNRGAWCFVFQARRDGVWCDAEFVSGITDIEAGDALQVRRAEQPTVAWRLVKREVQEHVLNVLHPKWYSMPIAVLREELAQRERLLPTMTGGLRPAIVRTEMAEIAEALQYKEQAGE